MEAHVSAFVGERLQKIDGASIAFSELRSGYEVWCAERGELSLLRFAAVLTARDYEKWKSCGLIRYRGLQTRCAIRRKPRGNPPPATPTA
jgi:hypothetical protein